MCPSFSDHLSYCLKRGGPIYEREGARLQVINMARLSARAFNQSGLLKIHEVFYPCQIFDMTLTGARLRLELLMELPPSFPLHLTRDGKAPRACSLIWQDGHDAGVSFGEAVPPAPTD